MLRSRREVITDISWSAWPRRHDFASFQLRSRRTGEPTFVKQRIALPRLLVYAQQRPVLIQPCDPAASFLTTRLRQFNRRIPKVSFVHATVIIHRLNSARFCGSITCVLKGFYPSDRSYVPCAEKLKLTVSVPSEIPTEQFLRRLNRLLCRRILMAPILHDARMPVLFENASSPEYAFGNCILAR